MADRERITHGFTGEVGRDGVLTPEQVQLLNKIQADSASALFDALEQPTTNGNSPMVAMATGIGKGNIIHRTIERQMRHKVDSRVLVIAGTKTVLVQQTQNALIGYQQVQTPGEYEASDNIEIEIDETEDTTEYQPERSFLYRPGKLTDSIANVRVATIQTVQSALGRNRVNPTEYDLTIVDEVHNIGTKSRKEVLEQFPRVVGLTATAYRHSGKMKTPEQYGFEVVRSLSLPEAQEMRLLPPLVGMQINTKNVVDEIPMTTAGNIDYRALEKLLKASPDLRPYIADRVSHIINAEGRKYKTAIAVNFVWEAQELAALLKEKGISVGVAVNKQAAREIHSENIPAIDSIERYALPSSNDKNIQVIISPYVAGEGWDAPFTEVLVWASPTDSPLRYTQYTGRLARRYPGKLFGVVVDCLYQTSQYSWSYNMGMWMKGDVKQLQNGLLWLGPESDIQDIQNIEVIQSLSDKNDISNLKDLEGYTLIDKDSIRQEYNVPETTLWKIIQRLKSEYPNDFVQAGQKHRYFVSTEGDTILRNYLEARNSQSNLQISASQLGREYGLSAKAVIRTINQIQTENPSSITGGGSGLPYFATLEGQQQLRAMLGEKSPKAPVPEGFEEVNNTELKKDFQGNDQAFWKITGTIMRSNPDLFIKRGGGRPPYATPDGIGLLKSALDKYKV